MIKGAKEWIKVQEPKWELVDKFFNTSLLDTPPYHIDAPLGIKVKLDQNEAPWDWPDLFKTRVLERLKEANWNRYPSAFAGEIQGLIANYARVIPECLLTGPGSNMLLALLIEAIAPNLSGKLVLARPSFPLFESQCCYLGLKYETWDLTENFEYDINKIPKIPNNSCVIFASPNNPTGTSLAKDDFCTLLADNPRSLFIADEAYYEFSDTPYTDLLREFDNLVIVRTISKNMGAAGIRLGYVLASSQFIRQIQKLRLPYLLNHFSIAAAIVILEDPQMQKFIAQNLKKVRSERQRMYQALSSDTFKGHFSVIPSEANFLLLRWPLNESCGIVYKKLIDLGILVRNVSGGKGLEGSLRVTIGDEAANDYLLEGLSKIHNK